MDNSGLRIDETRVPRPCRHEGLGIDHTETPRTHHPDTEGVSAKMIWIQALFCFFLFGFFVCLHCTYHNRHG
jgi:hypothetical protein